MTDYQKKMARDRQDRIDRADPAKIAEALKPFGVVQTQMRTLLFQDAEQRDRILRTSPEVGSVFICMIRDHEGNAQL